MPNSESLQILQRKKESVSIGNVALYSGVIRALNVLDIRSVEDSATQYALAQAILDNIATHESGLIVRDIFPDLDFLDGAAAAITSREWRQPVSGAYASATGAASTAEIVYKTGTASKNDRKTIVLFGYGLANAGPARATSILNSVGAMYSRTDVKVIDVHQTQHLETADPQIILFRTPILAKKNDDMWIKFVPNASTPVAAGKFDQIIIYGKVVESVGQTAMG